MSVNIYENISRKQASVFFKRKINFFNLKQKIKINFNGIIHIKLFLTNVFGLVSIDRGGRLPSINFISE